MAKFEVSMDMLPGMQRNPYGFMVPGQVFEWPTDHVLKGENPSLKLIPLDDAAYKMLVEHHGAEVVRSRYGEGPAPEAKEDNVIKPKSSKKKVRGRASDSK